MKRSLLAAALFLLAVPMFGQNVRTFISSVSGNDTGNTVCAANAPCRSLANAFNNTNAGGDILFLDSGGYGPGIVINKAINIIVPSGIFATLTPTGGAGTAALLIVAGASDVVRIDGLGILGTGAGTGQYGVNINSCKRTELSNMKIRRIGIGVNITGNVKVDMRALTITDVTTGIKSQGTNAVATGNPLRVRASEININGCAQGVRVEAGYFNMAENSNISFCTVDAYIIEGDVASCGNVAHNGRYNNFTGITTPVPSAPGAVCDPVTGLDCTTDARRGDITNGDNCKATP